MPTFVFKSIRKILKKIKWDDVKVNLCLNNNINNFNHNNMKID